MPLYHDALPDDDDAIEDSPRRSILCPGRSTSTIVLDSPSNGALAILSVPSSLTRRTSRAQQADSGPAAQTEVNCGLQQAFANLRRPYPVTLLAAAAGPADGVPKRDPHPLCDVRPLRPQQERSLGKLLAAMAWDRNVCFQIVTSTAV